jgi:hypothetical protein
MSRLVQASERALADAIAQMMREAHRLDAWSFWTVPGRDHVVVAGSTGVFLVVPEIGEGVLEVEGRRVTVGSRTVRLRSVRAAARKLRNRLGTGAVGVTVEPVLCLIGARAGAPLTVRGVRILPVAALASDLARREKILAPTRAHRVVRNLGMVVAGDQRRPAAALRHRT